MNCLFCEKELIMLKCNFCNISYGQYATGAYRCWHYFKHNDTLYVAQWFSELNFQIMKITDNMPISVLKLQFLPKNITPQNIREKISTLLVFS